MGIEVVKLGNVLSATADKCLKFFALLSLGRGVGPVGRGEVIIQLIYLI